MRRRAERGFTLVEALIALMIMVALLTLLYRGLTSALRVSAVSERAGDALRLARAKLAAAGVEAPLQVGEIEGQDDGLRWAMRVRPHETSDERSGPPGYWVTVTVWWQDAARSRDVSLTTLKLGPASP